MSNVHESWCHRNIYKNFPHLASFNITYRQRPTNVVAVSRCCINVYATSHNGDGGVVRWRWVNFQCRGVLLIWELVGKGPTALAVGAGGACLDFFSLVCHFSVFSPLGDGPIYTEILFQSPLSSNHLTSHKCHFTDEISFFL